MPTDPRPRPSEPVRRPSPRLRALALALALAALTLAAYAPALRAGFIWDDDDYLTDNPAVWEAGGLARIWRGETPQYYPLVFTSFRLEHALWGMEPAGYHWVNVALHLACAAWVWRALALFGAPWAWLAAALFALHPTQVESVAWITERKNVLSGAFYGAALWLYLRRGGEVARDRLGALALFACALLSKTTASTLPAALLLILAWRRGPLRAPGSLPALGRDAWRLAPFFAAGVGFGLLTAHLERVKVGALGPEFDLSWLERAYLACRAPWFYLGKTLWPHPISFNYPKWDLSALSGLDWWPLAATAAVAALSLRALWTGRGAGAGLLAALYAAALFPALGLFNVWPFRYSYVADHFQYLAAPAACSAAAWALWRLGARWGAAWRGVGAWGGAEGARGSALRAAPALAAALLLAALAWRSNLAARAYRDPAALWASVLATNPGSALAHNNLAAAALAGGRLGEALRHYSASLAGGVELPETHNNLGVLHLRLGRPGAALERLDDAIRLDPAYADAHYNRAAARGALGDPAGARADLLRAAALAPGHAVYARALRSLEDGNGGPRGNGGESPGGGNGGGDHQ